MKGFEWPSDPFGLTYDFVTLVKLQTYSDRILSQLAVDLHVPKHPKSDFQTKFPFSTSQLQLIKISTPIDPSIRTHVQSSGSSLDQRIA
jgi:hypothetical protein